MTFSNLQMHGELEWKHNDSKAEIYKLFLQNTCLKKP